MKLITAVLCGAFLLPAFAHAESTYSDFVILHAVAFALTGNDDAEAKPDKNEKCAFVVNNTIFRMNNIHKTRHVVKEAERKKPAPDKKVSATKSAEDKADKEDKGDNKAVEKEKIVIVELHGHAPVYDHIMESSIKISNSPAVKVLTKDLKKINPELIKPTHTRFNQYTLTLETTDIARVRKAWDIIWASGCTGADSPF